MAQDDSKYSKPELRERIKDRVTAGSKGGKPGQWFCAIVRKAQTNQCKSFAENAEPESRMKILETKGITLPVI
jgi:hypothetical protein